MKYWLLLVGLLSLSGCRSVNWEEVQAKVEETVKDKIKQAVEEKLVASGASVAEVKSLTNSKMTPQEAIALVKEVSKDYLSGDGQKVVAQKLNEIESNLVSKSDLDAESKKQWTYVMGLISTVVMAYLGKQVFSAKSDGHRDARIDILEKLMTNYVTAPDEEAEEPEKPNPPTA